MKRDKSRIEHLPQYLLRFSAYAIIMQIFRFWCFKFLICRKDGLWDGLDRERILRYQYGQELYIVEKAAGGQDQAHGIYREDTRRESVGKVIRM